VGNLARPDHRSRRGAAGYVGLESGVIEESVLQLMRVDTDLWTAREWKDFILANVSPRTILRVITEDANPQERLRKMALAGYELRQAIADELKTWRL
jgi:hypothetical protein